jgi:hypothetical protein
MIPSVHAAAIQNVPAQAPARQSWSVEQRRPGRHRGHNSGAVPASPHEVGNAQRLAMQLPPLQSSSLQHSTSEGTKQGRPPQSTSVSEPFWTPSSQLVAGGMHVP